MSKAYLSCSYEPFSWFGGMEKPEALCTELSDAIMSSVKAFIESQGCKADKVVDDLLNFDMRKSRKEITEKYAR